MHSKSVIERLIEITVNTPPEQKLPRAISDRLTMSKEIVLELLSYYLTIKDTEPKKLDACNRTIRIWRQFNQYPSHEKYCKTNGFDLFCACKFRKLIYVTFLDIGGSNQLNEY